MTGTFRTRWMLPAAAVMLCGLAAEAKVELAPVFADNMVLQREMPVPVWGKADPGEEVTVKFADQSVSAKAADDGKWMVKLAPLFGQQGKPQTRSRRQGQRRHGQQRAGR